MEAGHEHDHLSPISAIEPDLGSLFRVCIEAQTAAMPEDREESVKEGQSDSAGTPTASSNVPTALSSRNAGSSSVAGGSRRSSLNKSGTRTPRFDLVPMTEYFESSPATPNDEGSDGEDQLGWGSMSEGSQDSPPASRTPTFNQSYNNLRRNLSMKSLRELELKHFQRAAWRKKDEPRKRPRDLEQLLVYAATGGARAFTLAYILRAGVNFLTTFIRSLQRRKLKASILLRSLYAAEPVRFGAMFGSYVFIWKMALHLLRLYNPGKKGKGRTEFWHAPFAGALSGLAVLAETKNSRIGIAQQTLVRGLQGWYNILHERGYINIAHGEVLLFGAACGQIMYSFLVSPEALNPGYRHWILQAGRIPAAVLPWVVTRHRTPFNEPPLERAYATLTRPDISYGNALRVEDIIKEVQNGDYGPPFAPCALVHPWEDSCIQTEIKRFKDVFVFISPVYTALHFIPPILFKRKQFVKDPLSMLWKSVKGTTRSSCFLATFVIIFQSLYCMRNNFWPFVQNLPKPIQRIWVSKYQYWMMGFATCMSLFVEEKKRRGELAMYVMPKALESAWSIARRRSYVPFIPGGEVLLSCAAMSMVMSTFQHEPKMLSGLVRTLVYQFVGQD